MCTPLAEGVVGGRGGVPMVQGGAGGGAAGGAGGGGGGDVGEPG